MSGRMSRGMFRGLNVGSSWASFMLRPSEMCTASFVTVRARFIVLYLYSASQFGGLAITRKPKVMMSSLTEPRGMCAPDFAAYST